MNDAELSRMLSKDMLYLFNTGKLYHAYRTFGAQLTEEGVRFTVWAPDVSSVRVVGDFNDWGKAAAQDAGASLYLRPLGDSGVFSGAVPGLGAGAAYKYEITTHSGDVFLKADPFAFGSEVRPATASVVTDLGYGWDDDEWMAGRKTRDVFREPMNIYEMHLGSWMRHPVSGEDEDGFYSYDDLAERLIPYLEEMGYTHVEFMPVMEHPLDASWGYQVTGYFAATSRYGHPTGLMKLIDRLHQAGIGVILDWVPGHFCPDAHGLAAFNGGPLFESEIHPDWGTYKFDFAKSEVRSFLLSNAMFWMEKYHADGLRVDGVSSIIYLNFGKTDESTYRFNREGGETDLDAIDFLRECNAMIGTNFPGTFTAAEESSAFPLVTMPPYEGGLGFHFKWNMGWMNDILGFMEEDFPYREHHHNELTFSMSYAFSENYILPLSHDEVVHGKKSLIGRMPGDLWRKFAGLRVLTLLQMTHPGKKLNFMGHENAPFIEWREYEELEWFMLRYEKHAAYRGFIRDINRFYRESEALWACEDSWDGFRWIDADNGEQGMLSYIRYEGPEHEQMLVVAVNVNLGSFDRYRLGVPESGDYQEVFSTDDVRYGGNGRRNLEIVASEEIPMHGMPYSIEIRMPVLGGTVLEKVR